MQLPVVHDSDIITDLQYTELTLIAIILLNCVVKLHFCVTAYLTNNYENVLVQSNCEGQATYMYVVTLYVQCT